MAIVDDDTGLQSVDDRRSDATAVGNDEAADQVPELWGDVDELTPPMPPDGGWGWSVVVASFFANLILDGVCYTFGVIMPALLGYFEAGKGKTAFVGSLLPGCYSIVGKSIIRGGPQNHGSLLLIITS